MAKHLVLLVAAGIAAAVPAAAATGQPDGASAPIRQITDRCGDADSRIAAAGQAQRLEPADPARDLAAAAFRITYGSTGSPEALVADVTSCGTASPAVEQLVQIGLQDRCVLSVQYVPRKLAQGQAAPQVLFSELCFDNNSSPTAQPREVSRAVLPGSAAVFSGDTTRITVPLAAVAAVTRPRFASGTVWDRSAALLADPDIGNEVLVAGTFPNPDATATVRLDQAQGSGYTVGQDAPTAG